MNKKNLVLFTAAILFLGACSSRQNIYIANSGKGSASIDVNLNSIVINYVRDLLGGFSGENQTNVRIFDIQKIKNTVIGLDGVFLTEITSDSPENLHLTFSFNNPSNIFKNPADSDIPELISFSSSKHGNKIRKKLNIILTRDNFKLAASLLGLENSEVLETFGPQENPYTSNEYLDLMDYLFDEYDTSANIRAIVQSSRILINLQTDGRIVFSKGCKVSDSGSSAVIEIPLLDIVTLEEPIRISVEWE